MLRGCHRVVPSGLDGRPLIERRDFKALGGGSRAARRSCARRHSGRCPGHCRVASPVPQLPGSALPERASVFVVVVAAQCVGFLSWSAGDADDGRDLVEHRQELSHVIAVSAGQRDRERDALRVDHEVVLAARPGGVDRAGPAFGPLRAARTWEESITARGQSSWFLDPSSLSSTACRRSHTPAIPGGQPPPAGHARAKSQLPGQVLPLDTGVQSEEDPARGLQVRHPRSAFDQLSERAWAVTARQANHHPSDTIHGRG